MNLIERYIEELGKHLPQKTRADIQTEIRSTLEDMLEERAARAGRPADDGMVKELLVEYGAPDKVAASYLPARYLIGPRLFPTFTLVLKIVFTVLTALALIGFGIRFGAGPMTAQAFVEIFGKALFEYIGGIIAAFGNIVLIFAILQWALPPSELEDLKNEQEWYPSELEKEPEPDHVGMWEPIWTIIFNIAALLIFNLYPKIIGFGFFTGNTWYSVPVLTDAFFHYLPWINLLWLLQIVLNIILLRQGRWTALTRWFEIGLSLISITIAYFLLSGPSPIALNAEMLTRVFRDAEAASTLAKIFSVMAPVVLIIIIVTESVDVAKSIYRLVFKPMFRATIAVK